MSTMCRKINLLGLFIALFIFLWPFATFAEQGVFVIGFVDKDSPLGLLYQQRKERNLFYRDATFYASTEIISLLQQNGFERPQIIQTVFGKLEEIRSVQDFESGYGKGGFVVMQARKEH